MNNGITDRVEVESTLTDAQQAVAEAYRKPSYRYLVLRLLTVVYAFNFIDRQAINVLAAYIIEDLHPIERETHPDNRKSNVVGALCKPWRKITDSTGRPYSRRRSTIARRVSAIPPGILATACNSP